MIPVQLSQFYLALINRMMAPMLGAMTVLPDMAKEFLQMWLN